jgi:hypothetical protein
MAPDNDFVLAMGNGILQVAPKGTPSPLPSMADLSSPWVDLGSLSTDGFTQGRGSTRTSFKRWGSAATIKTVITDRAATFSATMLELNPNALGLYFGISPPSPTGTPTSEVQTATITGSPTGGDFVLVYNDHATTDIAYNATAATVRSALEALPGIGSGNVAVSGSAGGPYTITFQGTLANTNVTQITATGNFTGGTSPAITTGTSTSGSAGNLLLVNPSNSTAQDLRAFCLDIIEGTNHIRWYLPNAEVTDTGDVVYRTDELSALPVTITAYPDDAGLPVYGAFLLDAVTS